MSRHAFEVRLESPGDDMFPQDVAAECEKLALDTIRDSGLLPEGCSVIYPDHIQEG